MSIDVVSHVGDPQIGHLATPVSASSFSKTFIQNLPIYRAGLSPIRRGLEVGQAHGYFLFGPFALTGQFRNTVHADLVGAISASLLILIFTLGMSLYASVNTKPPLASVTAPTVPAELATKEGWSEFAGGFLLGGIGGVLFAYAVTLIFKSGVFQTFANGVV